MTSGAVVKMLSQIAASSAVGLLLGSLMFASSCSDESGAEEQARGDGDIDAMQAGSAVAPTFAVDVAPILYEHCAGCHRPGETAPFSLLSYADARRKRSSIAKVVRRKLMPPWLPTEGDFLGARGLSGEQIETLERWAAAGGPRGDAEREPAAPTFVSGWQFGQPDLIVVSKEVVEVDADGADRFVNLVLALPDDFASPQSVLAFELRPGSPAVHHAILAVDPTRQSQRRADRVDGPGYDGMDLGTAAPPDGHFLGWTPGSGAQESPRGLPWRLRPGDDLVLQLHLTPTGKPESVRPRIGLFFTDEEPRAQPYSLVLYTEDIDIPPGAQDHVLRDRVQLPVPVELLGVYPHAHYLCSSMRGSYRLPGRAESETLFAIDRWDFDWQDDYRLREPLQLPAGTELSFEYRFDNSVQNASNPHDPPKRVQFGQRSRDEMATLSLMVVPQSAEERQQLRGVMAAHSLQKKPYDWAAWLAVAVVLREQGRLDDAERALSEALARKQDYPEAWIERGLCAAQRSDLAAAQAGFERALSIDPNAAIAHMHLGGILARRGQTEAGVEHLLAGLEAAPRVPELHNNLATARFVQGRLGEAEAGYRRALQLRPDYFNAQFNLGRVLLQMGRRDNGLAALKAAQRLRPADRAVRDALAAETR